MSLKVPLLHLLLDLYLHHVLGRLAVLLAAHNVEEAGGVLRG